MFLTNIYIFSYYFDLQSIIRLNVEMVISSQTALINTYEVMLSVSNMRMLSIANSTGRMILKIMFKNGL